MTSCPTGHSGWVKLQVDHIGNGTKHPSSRSQRRLTNKKYYLRWIDSKDVPIRVTR